MPIETLPCGHPVWLEDEPHIIVQANRLSNFHKKHKRFPVWNIYSLGLTTALLIITRLAGFVSQTVGDIVLLASILFCAILGTVQWFLSRSDSFEVSS